MGLLLVMLRSIVYLLVLHIHGAIIGDVEIARHLCVIENTPKIHHILLKQQVGEIHLSLQGYGVLGTKGIHSNLLYFTYSKAHCMSVGEPRRMCFSCFSFANFAS